MKKIILFFTAFIMCAGAQNDKLQKGQAPPELTYFSLSKNEKTSYKEKDFVDTVFIIDFWATWCAPCIESIPHMNALVDKYKNKNVKFISITYEPASLAMKFLDDHRMKSDVGLDEDFDMFRKYKAWAIPNIIMINSKGKIAGRIHPNKLNEDVIDVLISGGVPEVENTPEDLFDPVKAEEYFRSFLNKQKEE
ncbi:MAG: TlpA family protein disulfide reductase [Ignavibacteriales bacterium]|nr:MAG: TlpA family protein disulfide reductase [Ignavibacteriales bacterium]